MLMQWVHHSKDYTGHVPYSDEISAVGEYDGRAIP
jgi:hypothetical protein